MPTSPSCADHAVLVNRSNAVTCEPPPARPLRRPRAFVIGAPRSGTTIATLTLRSFAGVETMTGGLCVGSLLQHRTSRWLVAQRTPSCTDHLVADLRRLRHVWIIDVVRDPRDVVTSVAPGLPGHCAFERWERDIDTGATIRRRHRRYLRIRYEDFLTRPEHVQQRLARALGWEPLTAFTTAHVLAPAALPRPMVEALGGVRPLDPSRAGRWRHDPASRLRVAQQLAAHPRMEDMLRDLGYPPTTPDDLTGRTLPDPRDPAGRRA
jgi:hypothetical protein